MLKLKFRTGNAAFDDDKAEECARILEWTARQIRNGQLSGALSDCNGNRVGDFCLTLKGA
ncbi:MAG: hypothetical protein A3E78_12260 [Alphaproteobacteria bacterium RIFCSPHIGHO2_12_FULL_63_12]|nr:MAG: hypothetical protein A3E78_12260 [Alphaproteobacteria bacterium RIFCSPHIGHO2_12_FULL_63_12]